MMKKRALALGRVYQLLEPGPVILVATSLNGKANIMTQSWHTMLEFEPPQIGVVISNRNHSFKALMATGECTLNIPTAKLAKAVVGCGNTSGRSVDKFKRYGLTARTASLIDAPLIEECFANLECRVIDTQLVEKFCFFVLEVVKAWIDPGLKDPTTLHHRGRGRFMMSGRTVKLPSKMK
jgi:flavin reductase (DIM6/NTAB) family NADH-FMN oxidoreductase RutF